MEAIILSGIQGAGKSTFCRERLWNSHLRLNYDMLRTRYREKLLLHALLAAKQAFVVDNTNPTPDDRARYVVPAKAAKFRVVGMQFDVPLEDALARNSERQLKSRIPEKGILGTAGKMVPLGYAEGFDVIYRVTCLVNQDFQLEEVSQ